MNLETLKNAFLKIKARFLDLLFPLECLGCGKENEWLCQSCINRIKYKKIDQCVVCKESSHLGQTHPACQDKTFLDGVIIAADWEDQTLQTAIHKYKYNFMTGLAGPLTQILTKKINTPQQLELWRGKRIILAPVPLHKKRLRWRGFNQAELLAEKIASQIGWEMQTILLARQRYTKPQAKLKKEEREKNLIGAFGTQATIDERESETVVILVDDVLTTGTTMNECAKILKQNGAKTVWGLALARG